MLDFNKKFKKNKDWGENLLLGDKETRILALVINL